MQNLLPSGASDSQRGQRIGATSGTAIGMAGEHASRNPDTLPHCTKVWMVSQDFTRCLVSGENHVPSTGARSKEGAMTQLLIHGSMELGVPRERRHEGR